MTCSCPGIPRIRLPVNQTTRHLSALSLIAAAVLGATGVLAGALGAHALYDRLEAASRVAVWETAVLYQLVHAVALLGLAAFPVRGRWPLAVAACWTGGTLLFAGSLYWLALGGPGWLGPVTPLGGLALLAGWCLLPGMLRPLRRV